MYFSLNKLYFSKVSAVFLECNLVICVKILRFFKFFDLLILIIDWFRNKLDINKDLCLKIFFVELEYYGFLNNLYGKYKIS